MANLRIISVTVIDSSDITATFTEQLSEDVGIQNVQLTSQTPGVPDPLVIQVTVVENSLQIITQPLTPLAAYYITFQSTSTSPFKSLNGDATLFMDGVTNRQLILGPITTANPIQQFLINFLQNNVYNLESDSVVSNYINGMSTVLARSLYDIRQAGNENYLSFTITDEKHIYDGAAFNRFNEESAYEVTRVGRTPTNTALKALVQFPSFPAYEVSLLATTNSENLIVNSTGNNGTFDLNTFTLNLSKRFAIILNSVTFVYNSPLAPFIYNIPNIGYQILDSRYDPNFAFTFVQLKDNQIRLNDVILSNPLFSTENIAFVQVSYQYKDSGRVVDPTSLTIDTILSSGREVVPPIENIFTLKHAPIVTSTDMLGTIADVTFIDPNAIPGSGNPHPAFLYEIPFRLDYLPSRPGEYAINYSTGTVYVFGATSSQDGTGPSPPLAVYLYRFVFKSLIDYAFQEDTNDIAALPNGSLTNSAANVMYNYEEVLAQGIDYKVAAHVEALNEFIDNRLLALNEIQPLNFPVTNVFRIFNQTTGEIYKVLRWTDNKIFFTYVIAPNIQTIIGERASFQNVLNEILFVTAVNTISVSQNIFKIFLANNNIINGSEDAIGSSINTSINFANSNIFTQEIYFDNNLTEAQNNARLLNIGDYQVDYLNGIVWCLVPSTQDFSIGTVSYKRGYVVSNNNHIITVNDIYYRFSVLSKKLKTFAYINFSDNTILPSTFDVSNEEFLNGNSILPYTLSGGQVGTFSNSIFSPGVSQPIKFIRALYEYDDVSNNKSPINFAPVCTFNGNTITVAPLIFREYHSVQFDGTNHYILANTNLLYFSPDITINMQITRLSDSATLTGTIVLGSPFKIVLSNTNTPMTGDSVLIVYSYTIIDLSRIVVDYNKGDYFIDYSYLVDDIVISYEYGDNYLDFRQSQALSEGDTYYVSYKVGALRDALLKNFGTLIDIPILDNLDTDFARERYRDALMAALQSFTTGPTLVSMENIVKTIVHTPPQIIESAFQNWTLGLSLLNPEPINTTGAFNLVPAKYDNGVVIDSPGQTVTFPVCSNLRLEQGSFECWIIPEWNGLDNQSHITIKILKNGQPLPVEQIFVGPAGYHPIFSDGYDTFTLDKDDNVMGKPSESLDGVFVYYAPDVTGNFNRWFIDVMDGYADGYDDGYGDGPDDATDPDGYAIKNYTIYISTDGKFYDVKSTLIPQPATDKIYSGTNTITYTITGTPDPAQGITFLADSPHYIFDFGKATNVNRFSLFKDESGFINFRVIDKRKNYYMVSSDVSGWKAGQRHHVAASWILSTKGGQDEMHLFIDGFEVPNIIVHGNKVSPYLHEKFRTVDPEEVAGIITNNIVSSIDLSTTSGSNVVSSATINFSAFGITAGSIIYVEEPGFATTGYTILIVNGNILTLNQNMPLTITDGLFTVNKTTFDTLQEIDLYPNIAVSLLHASVNGTDLATTSGSNVVSSPSSNFNAIGVQPGYVINIAEPNFAIVYTILAVNGHNLTLSDPMPGSFGTAPFHIYPNVEQEIPGVRALRPAYSLGRDGYCGSTLTILNDALQNDIVLIRTLGLNSRRINNKYYVWANADGYVGNTINPDGTPDGYVNVIKTRLPAPILLCDAKVTHYLLDRTNIGPSNSMVVANMFISNNIPTDQPSISDNGRTLAVNIYSSNVDYTTPLNVTITGTINGSPGSEVVSFTKDATINTVNKFSAIDHINVSGAAIDPSRNFCVVTIKEAHPITVAENSTIVAIIRYSNQVQIGNTLSGSVGTSTVTDTNSFFSREEIGDFLVISSPPSVAGEYQIIDVSTDHHSFILNSTLAASFIDGVYQVLTTSTFRSGLQNGFFTFENAPIPGQPYCLARGLYEFDYYSYLEIPLEVGTLKGYLGTDINGNNTVAATLDEVQILSEKITDTRIGETVAINQESITKDFNSLKALHSNVNTLMLLHFDTFPFTNNSDTYITATNKFIQSANSINDNFGKSIALTHTPLIIDNTGILHSKNEGTIEFWVNPLHDTANDPNFRYYFDATSIVSEKVISVNNAMVKVAGRISSVQNVVLQVGDQSIDYFGGGVIDPDMQTIFLNKQLPNQQTPVVVNYIPTGTNGDRISIYKDPFGYINFTVIASNTEFQVRSPIFWTKNSWHRLKAEFRVNTGLGTDEVRLFVDGYERGNVLFETNLLFGQTQVLGSSFIGESGAAASVVFKDTVNQLFIGSDYTKTQGADALINNLRISDIARPLFTPFGESIDVSYSPNLNIVIPVESDLFTTLLLDFDTLVVKNTDFATLKNKKTGLFDFTVNIFDSFGIVSSSNKVKEVLETLINVLKPANSRVFIRYI